MNLTEKEKNAVYNFIRSNFKESNFFQKWIINITGKFLKITELQNFSNEPSSNHTSSFGKIMHFLNKRISKFFTTQPAFEFVGDNWNDLNSDKPIAIVWGFNPWKRDFTSAALLEYRTAYIFGKMSWFLVKRHLKILPKNNQYVFISWSYKISKSALRYAQKNNIDVYYIEDGFLRSLNLQVKQTKPFSLCVDKKGMYFDANKETELEHLIRTYNFDTDAELKDKALIAIEIAKSLRLSKYYDLDINKDNNYLDVKDFQQEIASMGGLFYKQNLSKPYVILVIGQVADDASIIYGCDKKITNIDAIKQAHMDYPKALIYYRPHPDVFFKNRSEKSKFNKVKDFCKIVDLDIPLHNLFKAVDHVYTITSLAGFEALLYDKKVTTLGCSFYAGWGLTDDRQINTRRTVKRELWQVFAASYLLYPRYIHPISNKKIDFFELASYFFLKKASKFNIFKLSDTSFDLDILIKNSQYLSRTAQLLIYLYQTQDFASAKLEDVEPMIMGDNFFLEDFGDCALLLGKTSNFNILKNYCDFSIKYINNINHNYNITALTKFYDDLFLNFKYLKGRTINNLSALPDDFFDDIANNTELKIKFILSYSRILSANIQYDVLEKLLNNLPYEFFSYGHIEKICAFLNVKPFRKERNYEYRYRIIINTSCFYFDKINDEFSSKQDLFLNSALYYSMIDDKKSVLKSYNNYINFISHDIKSIKLRLNDVAKIYQYLIMNDESDFAEKMLVFLKDKGLLSAKYESLFFFHYFHNGKNTEIIQNYTQIKGNSKSIESYFIKSLKAKGEFFQSIKLLKQQQNTNISEIKYHSAEKEISQLKFSIESSNILNAYPQPSLPKGVIFIASQTCYNTLAQIIPVLIEAKKMGYAVINLTEGVINHASTGLDFLDKFTNSISLQFGSHKIKNEWYIDWSKKQVINDNVNYYQGFYEHLSVQHRKYHVDLNEKDVYKTFFYSLKRSDSWMSVCHAIYREVVLERQMPTVFISGNTHVTPFSIVRDFCMNKDHKLLSYINANVAYENYFSNLGGKFATTMCITDMTLHKTRRAPFLPLKDKFDVWYEKNKNDKQILEKLQPILTVNRNNAQTDDKQIALTQYLQKQKNLGKKIICAFGKIPVDLAVPYDGGPAHEDMDDWLNHTIEVCKKDPNIILLIKPHPHELKPEIAMDLITKLSDLIRHDLSDNIRLLGHRDINVHSLAPFLDLAILYNGSSSLELVTQGVPVMMTAYFGKHDYPVDLIYPESRLQYENYILAKEYQKPTEELRKKSAFLIAYMGTDDIAIPNTYSKRTITNDSIGLPQWDFKKIDDFLKNGDPYMTIAACRILEKFEGNQEKIIRKKSNLKSCQFVV